jgi:two-component system, NarL family, nitrate/nitrite response regulator NarL
VTQGVQVWTSRRRTDGVQEPARGRRVVVLGAHVAVAEALCNVLERAGYRASHLATSPGGALASQAAAYSPDVVVVGTQSGDLAFERMPLIAELAAAGIPVVGLAGARDDSVRRRLIRRAGATAVVGHADGLEHFVDVVGAVSGGTFQQVPLTEPGTSEDEARATYVAKLARLTPREREVLEHLRLGHPVDEIARRDHVARSTVRGQVASVLRKLEVSTQLAAVAVTHWATERDADGE